MPMTIGQVVRRLRDERGLSQYDINRLSNGEIKQSWVNSLEHGDIKNPPQAKLNALAELLGTTVAEIYREAGIIEFPARLNYRSALEGRILDEIQKLPPELQEALYQMIVNIRKQDARIVDDAPAQSDDDAKKKNAA